MGHIVQASRISLRRPRALSRLPRSSQNLNFIGLIAGSLFTGRALGGPLGAFGANSSVWVRGS